MGIHIYFGEHCALGFSRTHQSNVHGHLALQLTMGLERDFYARFTHENTTATLDIEPMVREKLGFACFAPEQRHVVEACDDALAYLYLDCGAHNYQRWRAAGGVPVAPDEQLRQALLKLKKSGKLDAQYALALAQQWQQQSLPGLVFAEPSNPRIANAVQLLKATPLGDHSHVSLAQHVNLSPSRFAHLFREHMGVPVRNYLLWRRLVYALGRIQQGDSVTTAAYSSGFSDTAHMSRSFRKVFGASPSDLQAELGVLPRMQQSPEMALVA